MTYGLHHVTAIASDARRNLAFYTKTLGLRLVKKTVNFDDPGTYHFYYGDEAGSPGTILTFFPWSDVPAGRPGRGLTQETAFRVPKGALEFWLDRFITLDVPFEQPSTRFGQRVLPFRDPDGMELALVETTEATGPSWSRDDIPADAAIRGFDGVALRIGAIEPTAAVLRALGFAEADHIADRVRFMSPAKTGAHVDLIADPSARPGEMGGGSVHHVAFRAANDAEQAAMAEKLMALGIPVTEQKDRQYFRSVYFREPGGIIFEIATDEPGFAIDEPAAALGQSLKLPPGLERHRAEIEAALPALG